jgi:hypothetical protein
MTKAEYTAYEQRVREFIEREGISFLSTSTSEVCGEDDGNHDPWFSWTWCECCQSRLGGNREYLYARNAEDAIMRFEICEDCVYYINYGRLDDRTMLEIQANG